jgi:hypothetical protein
MTSPSTQLAPSISLPLRFFVLGLISLAVFGATLPFYAPEVLGQHHYTQRTVAFCHLLTLGWATSIVLGATIQLVPVALGVRLHSERLARWSFWFYSIGIVGMVASFWVWDFRFVLWFGSSVSVGLGVFVYNIARTLKKVPKHDLISIHIATAMVYLGLTFLAGQYLMHDKVIAFSRFHVLSAIHAHAHLAFLGWFFMMIVGVSYRLIPMFTLSSIQSTRRAWSAYGFLNVGILGVFFGILLQRTWLPIFAMILGVGLGLWVWEIASILKHRNRLNLDSPLKRVRIAVLHVPVVFILGLWLSWPKQEISNFEFQAQTSYAILALLGLVSFFILGILHKIIPFSVWYSLYPPLVGKQEVPKLQDLYFSSLEKWSLPMFLVGVWAMAISTSLAHQISPIYLYASASLFGVAVVLTVGNLLVPILRLSTIGREFFERRDRHKLEISRLLNVPTYGVSK